MIILECMICMVNWIGPRMLFISPHTPPTFVVLSFLTLKLGLDDTQSEWKGLEKHPLHCVQIGTFHKVQIEG